MAKYNILGIDPASTRNIGWSIIGLSHKSAKSATITEWTGGTFVLPTMNERWEVLWPMFMLLDMFVSTKTPDLVILEKTNQFRQMSGGFITGQVSHCMGVIYAVCGKHKLPVEFAFPTSVKKIVAGSGKASKTELKNSTKTLLQREGIEDVSFDSQHTADAAATIFYWLITNGIVEPLAEGK